MINLITAARDALEARREDGQQWSRLDLAGNALASPVDRVDQSMTDLVDEQDDPELRRYLAVQTSQVV